MKLLLAAIASVELVSRVARCVGRPNSHVCSLGVSVRALLTYVRHGTPRSKPLQNVAFGFAHVSPCLGWVAEACGWVRGPADPLLHAMRQPPQLRQSIHGQSRSNTNAAPSATRPRDTPRGPCTCLGATTSTGRPECTAPATAPRLRAASTQGGPTTSRRSARRT